MPAGTSTQRAELIALTKALELGQEKKIKVYTDSHYAFLKTHIQGAIYKERKDYQKYIWDFIENPLRALWEPQELAIIHCPDHRKGMGWDKKETIWLTKWLEN